MRNRCSARAPDTARLAGWLGGWAIALALVCPVASAASLDSERLPAIQDATFEVVSAKPAHDPLQYEKPLPLELLPFQERNDKFYSIGTAFAIGNGRYVTAAHVLLSGLNSQWGPPALRDNRGNVYAIDQVRKFSLERDFVVFTLTNPPSRAALAIDTRPAPGQVVYSVGNAYGTGVVIRDGLYTSDTPEEQDGRWKWMRFSAAASPGNSGGPLVDKDAKVIGVVLAKSPNENLNYALPIGMVEAAPDDVGEMDVRIGYRFDVFDTASHNPLKAQFRLPLKLADFFATTERLSNDFVDAQLKQLLAKEPLFPDGTGTSDLLHSIPSMADFPYVIARDDTGTWVLSGKADDDIRLSANGYLTPGSFGKNMLMHLRKPDDVTAAQLFGDPSVPMGLLLKTGFVKRPVGSQKIAVTSLGAPTMNTTHADRWGRTWQVWEWPLPYANSTLIVLALPVPDGYVAVARYAAAIEEHDQLINARALTDFVYVNYDGTLAQWREFLAQPARLPAPLRGVHIDFDYGKRFEYDSGRLEFAFTPELQAIQPESVLTLGFSYFVDQGKPTWDVAEVWLSAKATENNYVMVVRQQAPSPDLDDDRKSFWDKVVSRRHPFDAVPRNEDDTTKISATVGADAKNDQPVAYTASYTAEGARPQDEMHGKLSLLLKTLRVSE